MAMRSDPVALDSSDGLSVLGLASAFRRNVSLTSNLFQFLGDERTCVRMSANQRSPPLSDLQS